MFLFNFILSYVMKISYGSIQWEKNSLMFNLCKINRFDWNTDFKPFPGTCLLGVSVVTVERGGSPFYIGVSSKNFL